MIRHIVLFKLKSDATPEALDAAGAALRGMQHKIPEIRAVSWGPNLGPSADRFSHVLMVTLDDMAAVERYLRHPAHREAVDHFVAPIREDRLAADLEEQ